MTLQSPLTYYHSVPSEASEEKILSWLTVVYYREVGGEILLAQRVFLRSLVHMVTTAQFVNVMGFMFPVRAPCCVVLTCSLFYIRFIICWNFFWEWCPVVYRFIILYIVYSSTCFKTKSGIVSDASFINLRVVIYVDYSLKRLNWSCDKNAGQCIKLKNYTIIPHFFHFTLNFFYD